MKKIAFILDYLYTATYQQEAARGIISAFANRETELYLFLGGPLDKDISDPFVTYRNFIYSLITKEMFDGIIVCTTIGTNMSEDMSRFLSQFAGIPIVFYGPGPDRYSQVLVDNLKGMELVVGHLIRDHHCKRIAFITGLESHKDMEERFSAYKNQLEAAGLPFNSELVYRGVYSIDDGIKAVSTLLDQRHVVFDALVASTDLMALGAKLELERRGYKIPADIAIAGFDDIADASSVLPGLTTVRQPYNLIGDRVIQALEDITRGRESITLEHIPAELIIRQSCGCLSSRKNDFMLAYEEPAETNAEVYYTSRRIEFRETVAAYLSFIKTEIDKNHIESFLDSIFNEIIRERTGTGLQAMRELLIFNLKKEINIDIWQNVLTLIRSFFSPLFTVRTLIDKVECFFQKARLMVCDFVILQKNQSLMSGWKQIDQISLVCETLSATVETRDLREEIYQTFPLLNIRNFLFAEFFHDREKVERVRLIALILGGKPEPITDDVEYLPTRLFPDTITRFSSQFNFVLPVIYQENKLGYVIFERIEGLETLYATLTRELTKNLFISKLIKKRKDAEESLKTIAVNLEFKNKELEDFTRIASHDLKEPLRKISFFGDKLKKSIAGKMDEEELNYLERMQHASSRMEELIEGLLAYSRITTKKQPFVRVNLNTIISEVLQDLEIRIAESKGVVQVGELPSVNADPLQMRQLFQNLIGNALKYRAKDIAPLVVIASTVEGDTCKISVSDNGIGFDQNESWRIFGIFERLVGKSEYEGTGVGLAICKKIVEHHGGTIDAFGEPGKGARFVILMRYSD